VRWSLCSVDFQFHMVRLSVSESSVDPSYDPRWEKCFLVFFFRPKNTCFLVFFGQPVFFSAAGAFFFRGGRFIINITITLTKL
jgi:hypothetical protein